MICPKSHGEPVAQLSRDPSHGCHSTEGSPLTQVDNFPANTLGILSLGSGKNKDTSTSRSICN